MKRKEIIRSFRNPADRADFLKENILANVKSATRLLYFVIVFEVLMLLRMVMTKPKPYEGYVMQYIFSYSCLLVLSIVSLVGIVIATRGKTTRMRLLDILTTVYEYGILLWAITITTLDSYRAERFIVYLTVIVCMTSILKMRPVVFLSIEIGGFFLLNTAMILYLERINASQLINLTVFTIIFVVISIIKYNLSVDEYYHKQKISELYAMLAKEKEMFERAAKTDQLTGLFNRSILKADMEERLARNYRTGMAMGVAMFDLDDFKHVNDSYGHMVGDECLRKLGDCFRMHPLLTVYRYGGEEFLAIGDGFSEADFLQMLQEILQEVAAFSLSVETLHITVSAGYLYAVPQSATCDEKLIQVADTALYAAKAAGKNRMMKGQCDWEAWL